MRVLVAEDDAQLCAILEKHLTAAGYGVDACQNGLDALDYLTSAAYDAAVMDIMMPGISGVEALRRAREKGVNAPVLLLTALDGVSDRVRGLDAGADDYLVKPFSLEELSARLRALTRRATGARGNTFAVGDLTLDVSAHAVRRAGKDIDLSAREFSILEYMIRNAGVVLSRERIEEHIWNYDYAGGSNVVDVYIRYLRRKIDEGFERKLLHTVRGAGYVLRDTQP